MTRTPRHHRVVRVFASCSRSLATLLALADPAVAGPPGEGDEGGTATGFATTDATDPYLWLEEIDSTRALDWVRAQNAATERKLATQPLYQELRREALAALDSPSRLPSVNQMGKWIYNFWKDDQHPRGIYRRATLEELRKPNPAWEVVLDVDDLAKREGKPWVFHGMDCLPPEYRKCLVSLSPGGGDADEVREFDPKSLAFEPQGFSVPTAKSNVAWRDADSLFIGTDFGPGSLTTSGYPRTVRLWKRGTPLASAPILFEAKPESVGATGYRLHSAGGDVDLIADNRTFYENRLLPGACRRQPAPTRPASDRRDQRRVRGTAARLAQGRLAARRPEVRPRQRPDRRSCRIAQDRRRGRQRRHRGAGRIDEQRGRARSRGGQERHPGRRARQRAGSSLPLRGGGAAVDAAADPLARQRQPGDRLGGWHERRRFRHVRVLRDAADALLRGRSESRSRAGQATVADLRRQPLRGEPALDPLGRRHAGALLPGGAEGHEARRQPPDAHLLVRRLPQRARAFLFRQLRAASTAPMARPGWAAAASSYWRTSAAEENSARPGTREP